MEAPYSLFVTRRGEGPSVLYVHGLGASARYWNLVIDNMDRHTAIAPDLLGFGRSPKPADAAYDVATHVACLLPLVPDRTVVVGHSTGAILAAALARAAPDRIRALLLLGLPAFPDEATARENIGRLGTMARLTASGSPLAHAICMTMCRLRPLLIPLAPRLVRDLPAEVSSDFLRHTWSSYSGTLRSVVLGHPVLDDLAAVEVPTVLLHGQADRDAPIELAEKLTDRLRVAGRNIELHAVDGDHHLALRHTDVVVDRLRPLVSTTIT
jgi:pimeloyl-ACP methyl ester carboxylesterase